VLLVLGLCPIATAGIITNGDIDPADPSTWTSSTQGYIGFSSAGTLDITLGSTVSNAHGSIGFNPGGVGTVTVDGAGSTWTNGEKLYVGMSGTATLNITNGGAVSNVGFGYIGVNGFSVGTATVDGAGSTWTNISNLYIGYSGTGTLNITHGGLVTAATTASINSRSCLSIEVSNNDMFTVGTTFTNDGTVRLSAQAGLAAGEYTPISVGGTWNGAGTHEAFGGVWDNTGHTFTVGEAAVATAGVESTIDLSTQQRIDVGDSLCLNFGSTAGSTSLGVTATATNGTMRSDLESLLPDGETVGGSWDFDVTGLPGGDSVQLQFAVTGTPGVDDLTIWHYDGATGWTLYDAGDLTIVDGWASFSVDRFSSYAVAGVGQVPEPATMSLLVIGGIALIRKRRRA
jgi:T5SS/PEP-CTERM-associated repeat protein